MRQVPTCVSGFPAETGSLQTVPSATQSGRLWHCRDRWNFPRGLRGFAGIGGTRDAREGLNRPHFRFSSLISISEGQVYAKWGAGADRGPYGSGKEAIQEAQNRGQGYRDVAGYHIPVQVRFGLLDAPILLSNWASTRVRQGLSEASSRKADDGVVGSTSTRQRSMAGLNRAINAGSTFCGAHAPVLSSFVFLDTSASSEGWHVQWERVPPGKKLAPRSLSHVRGGNETDEAD